MANEAAVPARELSSINFRSMLGGPLQAVVDAQSQAALSTVNFIKSVGFLPADPQQPGGADTGEPIYVSFKYPKEVKPYEPAIEAAIVGITIGESGSGYTSAPTVTFSGGGSPTTEAAATAEIDATGRVVAVNISEYGAGYSDAPTVDFSTPPVGGTKAEATVGFQEAKDAESAVFQEMRLEVPILTMLPIPFIRIEETTIDFNAKINSIEEAQTNDVFKVGSELKYRYGVKAGASVPIKMVSLGAKISASVNLKVSTSYQRNTSSGYKVDRTYSMNVHIRAVQDEMPAGMERLLGILEDNIQSQPQE